MTPRTVLVTDGEQRAALAVVRSLGRAGHRVLVASERARSLAGASRHARGEWRVASALHEPDIFVRDIAALIERERVDVVLPIAEPALLALLAARPKLHGACLPFVDAERFGRICDKAVVLEAARALGIASPAQRVVPTASAVGALLDDLPPFPVVLKPARSVGEHEGRRAKLSVVHAATPDELRASIGRLGAAAFPLLVQQRIVGPGVGIFLLLWSGELLARFAHRRIREKPPSGGVSVYRESIAPPSDLVRRSRALLEHFGWQGVAMIEYKVDASSGTPYLMEINGRFWGSLQLAMDAGVDFPRLLLAAACGEPVAPVLEYRAGVRSRWWWGDVDHLVARLRRSPAALALPPGAPGRGRALLDFLTLWRPGDRNEILRVSDPAPFVRESLDWVRGR